MITDWLTKKVYLSAPTATNTSQSSTYKMAARINLHRYWTKLRQCHVTYTRIPCFENYAPIITIYNVSYFSAFSNRAASFSAAVFCVVRYCSKSSWHQYRKMKITRISIQTAGLSFGGTGLWSCRVRGVDGSCAKHLTVESYTVIYAANSHTYYY